MDQPDTDKLMLQASQGNQSAADQLLLRHRDRLSRFVMLMLNPQMSTRIDASDVLQEALASAAKKLPQYLQQKPVAFYPWLRQIVKETLIDLHRRHLDAQRRTVKKEVQLDYYLSDASAMQLVDRLVSQDPSPSNVAQRNEMKKRVKSAMDQIPSQDRELLFMRFFEQLRTPEMARILEVSEVTVRNRLRRAIEQLGHLAFGRGGSSQ